MGKATEVVKPTFNSFTNLREKRDTSREEGRAWAGWELCTKLGISCREWFPLELGEPGQDSRINLGARAEPSPKARDPFVLLSSCCCHPQHPDLFSG